WPEAFEVAVGPDGKVTPAPLAGPPEVTVAPGTAFPKASVTFATSWPLNTELTVADWPPPETAATAAGAPGLTGTPAEPAAVVNAASLTVTVAGPAVLRTTEVKACWPLSAAVNV